MLAAPANLAACEATLSKTELERAERFHFERDRNRFVAGRGLLRAILSRYLQVEPPKVEFACAPQGKPSLSGAFAASGLQFNLAHSRDLALLAVTTAGPVGVDVEAIDLMPDAGDLVARLFSARESAAFHNLPEAQRAAAFFHLWTRKEAWLKATGEGIGSSLNRVEVSFLPGEPARLLSVPDDSQAAKRWRLYNLTAAPGFAAALAIPAPAPRLCCWKWSEAWVSP